MQNYDFLVILVSLLGIIGLIFLTYFGTRWLNKKFRFGSVMGSAKGITVIECIGIAQDKQLMVVTVGKKTMLLGVTAGSINKICDLDDGDLDAFQISSSEKADSSFLNNLKKAFAENTKINKSNSPELNYDFEEFSKSGQFDQSKKDGRDNTNDF